MRTLGITAGLAVMAGGVAAARIFHFRRWGKYDQRRLEQKDLDSRRDHFRGRLDLELPQQEP